MDALKRMPWMLQDAAFKKLSEITDIASLDKEERKKYDESLRHYRDTLIVMEGQYLEGEAKGLEKGRCLPPRPPEVGVFQIPLGAI